MAVENYKAGTISGDTWIRAKCINITNDLNAVPAATFAEEQVVVVGDVVTKQNIGDLTVRMKDPLYEFPVRDIQTGDIIEGQTAKYVDIYALLYSAYYDAATKRDDGIYIGFDEPENPVGPLR